MHLDAQNAAAARKAQLRSGFTLHSLMAANAIFLLIISGVISVNLIGLRFCTIAQATLTASAQVRRLQNGMAADLHAAKVFRVGMGTRTEFREPALGLPRQGNALLLWPDVRDTNRMVRYFFDPGARVLNRVDEEGRVQCLVEYVEAGVLFSARDSAGAVLTNARSAAVVSVQLECRQLPHLFLRIGPGEWCESFELTASAAPRSAE